MPTTLPNCHHSKTRANRHAARRGFLWFALLLAVTVLLMIVVLWCWMWVQKPTSFPIKKMHIQGQLIHETPAQIQTIAQSRMIGGFFSLNLTDLKQAILALPWIQSVSFRRIWPDALMVHIVEQKSVARFGKHGVLNADGNIFYPDAKTIPANLPQLNGTDDQSKVLLNFYRSTDLFANLLDLTVINVSENAEQSWQLTLSNQVVVMLGHDNPLDRFKRFIVVYPKIVKLSTHSMVSADLRYPNGIAVQYSM